MLVFCEECGKRYSFPPEKLEAGSGQFRCRECGFLLTDNMELRNILRRDEGFPTSELPDPDYGKRGCCNKPDIEKRF